jgi:peptidoglycan/xylan/chitin deacetylase (PgdA/CDA1 family)
MISLYYATDDPFSLYGIRHFIEKTGIAFEINKPSTSGVVIAYGIEARADFLIQIGNNEIKNQICGRISLDSEKIPICEIPYNTDSGSASLAYFETEDIRFPCLTRDDRGVTSGIDIFKETGYLLSGHLDAIRPSLDSTTKKDLASKSVVDFLENILFNAVLAGCRQQKLPLVQKSFWPEGKKFAVCLTHDVDELSKTYQWITRPLRYFARKDLKGIKGQIRSFIQKIKGFEPYYTYDDIMRIEEDLGVKSTYYILKESGHANFSSIKTWYLYGRNRSLQSQDMRNLLRSLILHGDEIAIHGSYFSYKDPVLLANETRELEQLINEKIIGTRQHNLNLDVPATWHYQVMAGLKYDTSLGYKDTIGFRWGTSFPFFPHTGGDIIGILEIPLIIMDICLESLNNKESDCLQLADEVGRYHGVLTLLWHPPLFNALEFHDARDLYLKINEYCQEKGAWITRARDIHDWISLRNSQTFSCSFDGSMFTIIPSDSHSDNFFTLYLPPGTEGKIHSNNANLIDRQGDYMCIKTQDLNNNNEIVVDIV